MGVAWGMVCELLGEWCGSCLWNGMGVARAGVKRVWSGVTVGVRDGKVG